MGRGEYKGAFAQSTSQSTNRQGKGKQSKGPTRSISSSGRVVTVGDRMTLSDRFRSVSAKPSSSTRKQQSKNRGGIVKMTGIESTHGGDKSFSMDVEMKPRRTKKQFKSKFGRQKGKKVTKEGLDSELDSYMMKDAEIVKSKLDNDLAEYMQSEKL